jgi:hypothetical protein
VFIGAAAGAAVSAWAAEWLEWALPARLAFVAVAAACGVALGFCIAGAPRVVEIGWDGRDWHVDGSAGELQVMLDFDRWLLLLRHRPRDRRAGVRWVAISFAPRADDLRALRTALYSSPPEATPDLPHVRAPDRATD